MTAGWIGGRLALLGAALAIATPLAAGTADARSRGADTSHRAAVHASARVIQAGMSSRFQFAGRGRVAGGRVVRYGGGLQCVPFARENSGIELSGNALTWWSNAEGVYERGARPEVGSVLNFRANGRMRMGHVAVVANVMNGRTIEIDHANWSGPGAGRGGISRNITVVDVSERNDWSAVRVGLGHSGDFGSIYPTYGFIYDRPDRGTMVANAGVIASPILNSAPRDLRPASDRLIDRDDVEEVAEAADDELLQLRRVSARRGAAWPEKIGKGRTHLVAKPGQRAAGKPTVVKVHSRGAEPARPASRRHRL